MRYQMFDVPGSSPSPMQDKPLNGKHLKPDLRKHASEGLSDYAQQGEPHQRYWQILNKNIALPPQKPVIVPPQHVDNHCAECTEYSVKRLMQVLSCTPILTKRGYWVEPPSQAVIIDQSTIADGIPVPASGVAAIILRIVIPDRFYGVICSFGNALESDLAFRHVEWQIRINDQPLDFSMWNGASVIPGVFRAQLGHPDQPTELCMPILAKYQDVISVTARSLDAAAHTAYARMQGWEYAVRTIDGEGFANEGCQYTGVIPLFRGGGGGDPVY